MSLFSLFHFAQLIVPYLEWVSYAKNILFRTTPQVNQTDDLAKALSVTPQQGTAPIALPEARQLEIKENGDPLELYFNGFEEGRTGEPLAEAAGQSGAQGAALDAAGVRQDADVNTALSGQRVGELAKGAGNTTLADWVNKTKELAKTAPIKIPENATVKSGAKAAGYDQISYKWTEGGYKYEVRWHTKTPGAPAGRGNTWVVSRVTQGNPTGQRRVIHIMVGNTWVTRHEWQAAITAYQNGTMTAAQKAMLKAGHWLAP